MKVAMHRIVVAFILIVFGTINAGACECGDPPACAKVGPDAVIFVGVALNEAHTSDQDVSHPVRFRIERMFKGLRSISFVEIDTSASTSCEAPFAKGRRYLVYAKRLDTGRVFTSLCNGSKPINQAADDLRFLEGWIRNRTITSIQGQILLDYGQGNVGSRDRLSKNLRGSLVTAVNTDGQRYSSGADGDGRFLIAPVRAGTYKLTVTQTRFLSGDPEYTVNVPEGGCADLYVWMSRDGKVMGRLREPTGRPPVAIRVQLIPILQGDVYPSPYETLSGVDGKYEFSRIPPGRYLVAVKASDEPTPKVPYKRVYYPGVPQRDRATPIQVAEARSVLNVNFTVTAKLNPRTIKAHISWSDGSPARSVHTWCAAAGYVPWQHLLTDNNGGITFNALDGLTYVVGAAAASNYEIVTRRRLSAKPLTVPPGRSTSVKLVIPLPPAKP
jgi:hypothetical protein